MTTITGYYQDKEGSWIAKDPQATLTYTMEWEDWLPTGTSITSVDYTHNSRANDAAPLVFSTEGIQGTKTYVTISGGTRNRVYTVTAQIVLDNDLQDRRSFRIKVEDRSA
jgi:hypothetical protein